jgi:GGDEF domain-containing protein
MPEDAAISEDLMPAADRALYVAKRLGRNAIEVA